MRDGVTRVKDRLLYVNLRDRSGRGANAQNVAARQRRGESPRVLHRARAAGRSPDFHAPRRRRQPGRHDESAHRDDDRYDRRREGARRYLRGGGGVRGCRAARVCDELQRVLAHAADPLRRRHARRAARRSRLPKSSSRAAETRAKIDAAIPNKPIATPKKARKLLVIESLEGMSHNTIPLTNVMIQRMGEKTGAWTTVFSNDLNNLRYPKVKEYDAIFLNSIVGEFLPDPAMRADLVRYVNEGGGIGGIHGTPWASRNWDEFAEMIGAQSAPHRIENGIMRVYDKESPDRAAVQLRRPAVPRGVLPLRGRGQRPAALGQSARAADRRPRRESAERRPTSRGPVTSGRTRCTRWRGSASTARAACSTTRWAT